jgi:hypothetical protein
LVPVQRGFGEAVALTPLTPALTTTEDVVAVVEQLPTEAYSVYIPAFAKTTPVTPVLDEVGEEIAVPPGLVQK